MEWYAYILIAIVIFGLYVLFNNKHTILKAPFDYQFRVFRRAYRSYNYNTRCYKIYSEDFLSHYKRIVEGKIESNPKEFEVAIRICDIIDNNQELTERYFSNKFGYTQYLNMVKEYNLLQEEMQEEVADFEPIIEIAEVTPIIEVTEVAEITPATVTPVVVTPAEPLEVVSILEPTVKIETPKKNSKEKIDELIREEILKYEKEIIKPKHVGHRIFGFYLLKFHPGVTSESERVRIWRELTLLDNAPEKSYVANPYIDKNNTKITKTHIITAIDFCHSAGINVANFVKKLESAK